MLALEPLIDYNLLFESACGRLQSASKQISCLASRRNADKAYQFQPFLQHARWEKIKAYMRIVGAPFLPFLQRQCRTVCVYLGLSWTMSDWIGTPYLGVCFIFCIHNRTASLRLIWGSNNDTSCWIKSTQETRQMSLRWQNDAFMNVISPLLYFLLSWRGLCVNLCWSSRTFLAQRRWKGGVARNSVHSRMLTWQLGCRVFL